MLRKINSCPKSYICAIRGARIDSAFLLKATANKSELAIANLADGKPQPDLNVFHLTMAFLGMWRRRIRHKFDAVAISLGTAGQWKAIRHHPLDKHRRRISIAQG